MAGFKACCEGERTIPEEPIETSPLLGSRDPSTSKNVTTASVASEDDEEALLQNPRPIEDSPEFLDRGAVLRIILVLLIAVFIFHADHSLVLATHPTIGSEFNALAWSSWLFTSFGLAGAATQAVFGKLSDIYGRKPIILLSYAGFAIGCLIVAVGRSMLAVILGRVLSGSVGAGMTVLVSITISDLVPIRESGAWRAYVNVVATAGRSFGGPLGGWLADAVGWRWSFGCQVPMLAVAIFLCWRTVPSNLAGRSSNKSSGNEEQLNTSGKLARIDFLGSSLLAIFILLLLLPLELGGEKVPWSHPLIPGLFAAAAISLVLFVLVEKRWTEEPVLDLDLFKQRDAVLGFLIMAFQCAAQVGVVFCVPLYFQVTQKASNSEAGVHLLPSVVGSVVGGVFSGYFIKKTGRYKWLIYLSMLSGVFSYSLLLARWHGKTNWLESLYILLGGLGMGTAHSVLFVSTQASVDPDQASAAVSTLLLSNAVGIIIGVACLSAAMKEMLRRSLEAKLRSLGLDAATRLDIMSKAVSSVEYAYKAKGEIGKAIVSSYVDGLLYAYGLALFFIAAGFFLALFLRERKLLS
ncbi:MFS general substrate transporter [Cenococcum geophilum 1.58]|uniref:MFS general substrate transporter n=1 Tax=Cenococcum geophilum 1.58 TaxID=794803 RepID=A0ACC8EMR8_9PEZI|nr:MFS general substrate transporter [Cenococcum geophilum 1.58]